MRVLIIGAGGHGQVVASILTAMIADPGAALRLGIEPPRAVQGFVDDDPTRHGKFVLGLPVFGPLADRGQVPHDAVIVAIGDNYARRVVYERLTREEVTIATAIHPSAVIASDATIGAGCMIVAGTVINTGCRIGRNVIVNTGATVDHHSQIGDHVHLAPGTHLGGEVTVGEGALVGIGAIVMPRRTVGAWATVGAGAVVHRDVDASMTVVGVPARPLPDD